MSYLISKGVDKDWFILYQDIWDFVDTHYKDYGEIPSQFVISARFPDIDFSQIDNKVISDINWDYLIDEFRQNVMKTGMCQLVSAIDPFLIGKKKQDWFVLFHEFQSQLERLSNKVGLINDIDLIRDYDQRFEEFLQKTKKEQKIISTGFPHLDDVWGGFVPKRVIVIAARPGQYKSYLATRMGVTAVMQGYNVLYISLEMSANEVGYRVDPIIAYERSQGQDLFRNRALTYGQVDGHKHNAIEYKNWLESLQDFVTGKFIITTNESFRRQHSLNSVIGKIDQHRPDIVFVDYLTLLKGVHKREDIENATRTLKGAAQQFELPVVEIAQLNRSKDEDRDKQPDLDRLFGADAIGQDADQVGMLVKDNLIKFYNKKNRHGQDHTKFHIEHDADIGKFVQFEGSDKDIVEHNNKPNKTGFESFERKFDNES